MQTGNNKLLESTALQNSKKFLTKKKIIFGSIFLVILILVSVLTSVFFLGINFTTISELASKSISGKEWFLVGLLAVFLYQWFWSSYYIFHNARAYNVQASVWEWILFGITAIFINGVTPFALGAEPYKIYWLTRHGVNNKDAVLVVSTTSVYWTVTQILITWPSFIVISTHYQDIVKTSGGLLSYWFSFGGMLLDIIVFTSLLVMSFSSRFHVFIVGIHNKILKKLKKEYKTKEQIIEEFSNQLAFKKLYILEMKKWQNVLTQAIGTGMSAIVSYISVYFAIQLISVPGAASMSFTDIFNISNVAVSGNNFIPIPGAEGSMQIILRSFIVAFAGSTSQIGTTLDQHMNDLNQAIFIWRSFGFYLPVVTGLLFFPLTIWQTFAIEKSGKWKELQTTKKIKKKSKTSV